MICVVDTLELQGVSKEPIVHIVRDIERCVSSAIVDVHVFFNVNDSFFSSRYD